MPRQRITYLLQRYINRQLTDEESVELRNQLDNHGEDAQMIMKEMAENAVAAPLIDDEMIAAETFRKVMSADKILIETIPTKHIYRYRRLMPYAAAAIAIVAVGMYMFSLDNGIHNKD